MSNTVFDSGDEPYLAWIDANPKGFVLNASSSSGSSYVMFHASSCRHIATYIRSKVPGAFTERSYLKVCADELSELVDWVRVNRPNVFEYTSCKSCGVDLDTELAPLAEEVALPEDFTEGAVRTVKVNAYERNTLARKACIAHHGTSCVVCGFDFEKVFGTGMKGFIHVHHVVPISKIGEKYRVDPINDLVPVCPNCHAAIHHGGKTRTISEVKAITG